MDLIDPRMIISCHMTIFLQLSNKNFIEIWNKGFNQKFVILFQGVLNSEVMRGNYKSHELQKEL